MKGVLVDKGIGKATLYNLWHRGQEVRIVGRGVDDARLAAIRAIVL